MNKEEIKFIEVPEEDYFKMREAMQKIHQSAGHLYYHSITDPQKRNNEVYRIYELSKEQE